MTAVTATGGNKQSAQTTVGSYRKLYIHFSVDTVSLSNDDGDVNENEMKWNKRDEISAIKFDTSRLHFFSDVFVAVAVVAA